MSKFQIILLIVLGLFIVGGVMTFSFYRGSSANNVSLMIWGDISTQDFHQLINTPNFIQDNKITPTYIEKSTDTIEEDFTEELARGAGPDLIIITQDKLWRNKPKLSPIPYGSVSERDFKSTFIEESELFLDLAGIYALPISIDPLVLYYNRDLLSAVGQARSMLYWDEIFTAALNLSKRDPAGNLVSSVMALGEARNIPHAKDIVSLLLLQAGTPITSVVGNNLQSQIASNPNNLPVLPGEAAFDFYTQFSNPTKAFYSWNRSLPDARTHFTSGDSAYYIGYASELKLLKSKNPMLNIGVSIVPQSRVSNKVITFGKLHAVAISRGSKNPNAAFAFATKLSAKNAVADLAKLLGLPPVRRDLLSSRPADSVQSVFYDAALQSRGWIDPDSEATATIFDDTIESITSGRVRTIEAIGKASREMDKLTK